MEELLDIENYDDKLKDIKEKVSKTEKSKPKDESLSKDDKKLKSKNKFQKYVILILSCIILFITYHLLLQYIDNLNNQVYIKEKLFGLTKTITMPDFIEEKDITEDEVMELRKKTLGANSDFIGYIPSDRTFRASNPNLTVFQLCTAYRTNGKQKELEDYSKTLLEKADVNIRLYEKALCLSGGMLQRIILERELAESPKEIYLFDPTHGLDAEATERLYSRLQGLAKNGVKIIIGKVE